mgnify:FL=1
MKDRISELLEEVSKLSAENAEQLEALRIKYLSKKGEISSLFNDFKNQQFRNFLSPTSGLCENLEDLVVF